MRSKPFSLLAACVLVACGAPKDPELPASVSPGWTRTRMEHAGPPPQLSKDGSPNCYRAIYESMPAAGAKGIANIWVCRYSAETGAFEAVQRTRTEADTVKFQEGANFVLVHWEGASRDEIAELIRVIQKALKNG